MASIINTNIQSLNAQRNLSATQNSLATSMQRLSSGLRINSAKDDAAGLAISDRMTTQIRGINQAARNANDGVSLAQTAEGALSSIGNNLQRIRELAVQSRNATNSDEDRVSLQKEVSQLTAEIDRVASQTAFNGTKLLDGSFTSKEFQVGANQGQLIAIDSIVNAKTDALGGTWTEAAGKGASVTSATLVPPAAGNGTANTASIGSIKFDDALITGTGTDRGWDAFTIKVNGGDDITIDAGSGNETEADALNDLSDKVAAAISGAIATGTIAGATATKTTDGTGDVTLGVGAAGTTGLTVTTSLTAGVTIVNAPEPSGGSGPTGGGFSAISATNDLKINGVSVGPIAAGGTAAERGAALVKAINAKSSENGVTASLDADNKLVLKGLKGGDVAVTGAAAEQNGFTAVALAAKELATPAATKEGIKDVDVSTIEGADNAILAMDAALKQISSGRADLGAIQNRFASTVDNLQTNSENLSASRSRILDADFAEETANLSRAQILQQAGTAMVAQANQLPQGVLALLR